MNGYVLLQYKRNTNTIRITAEGDLNDRTVITNILLSHLEQVLTEEGISPADYYRALHIHNHPGIDLSKEAYFFNPIRDGLGDGEIKFYVNDLGVISSAASGSGISHVGRIQMILDTLRIFLLEKDLSWNDFWREVEAEVRERLKVNRWPLFSKSKFKKMKPSN